MMLTLRVLVVDDDADYVDTMVDLLQTWGFHTSSASCGASALVEARNHQPDVAILDLWMPGMDGCELAQQLLGNPSKPPFLIALTGCSTDEDRRRSAEAGIHLHLLKPVDPAVLVGILKRFSQVVLPANESPSAASRGFIHEIESEQLRT